MSQEYDMPLGTITIAPSVLNTIVRMTTLNQPGVLRLSPRTQSGLPRLRGKNAPDEGLRVEVLENDTVAVDVHVIADPAASLTDLGKILQTQIARALELMVGMQTRSVNVFIDEVEFDPSSKSSL